MDRRQKKSRKAIFSAFSNLLTHKAYSQITVNEIIEKADVCRSTFYMHFETKDYLLKELCGEIFEHIFNGEACELSMVDNNLLDKLTHVLTHLKNSEFKLAKILATDSNELFMGYLKGYLAKLFLFHLNDFKIKVSEDFFINHLVGSFSEAINWWVKKDMEYPPNKIANDFLSLIEKH